MRINNSKRQYFRKCDCSGCMYELTELISPTNSPDGWICLECFNTYHDPDYEEVYYGNQTCPNGLQESQKSFIR